ncbi:DUF456 domain-containing protein [Akkermansiaceae bacterium]|nr:DUF456 domain-containing protein [Akkermansiaceae bacterium]
MILEWNISGLFDRFKGVWEWTTEMLLTWGVWIAMGSLAMLGLLGTIVPFLPGHLLIFVAAFIPYFSLENEGGIENWGLIVLGLGLILAQVLEFLSGAVGTRWFGGTKWGAFGAFVGGIVGIFFMPFGLLLGPLIGAFACEWILTDKTVKPAAASGVGSVIGTVTGMVLKVIVALLMVGVLLADLFWVQF